MIFSSRMQQCFLFKWKFTSNGSKQKKRKIARFERQCKKLIFYFTRSLVTVSLKKLLTCKSSDERMFYWFFFAPSAHSFVPFQLLSFSLHISVYAFEGIYHQRWMSTSEKKLPLIHVWWFHFLILPPLTWYSYLFFVHSVVVCTIQLHSCMTRQCVLLKCLHFYFMKWNFKGEFFLKFKKKFV